MRGTCLKMTRKVMLAMLMRLVPGRREAMATGVAMDMVVVATVTVVVAMDTVVVAMDTVVVVMVVVVMDTVEEAMVDMDVVTEAMAKNTELIQRLAFYLLAMQLFLETVNNIIIMYACI